MKVVRIAEYSLGSVTKFLGDGVEWFQRREIGVCVFDHLTVLDVESSNLNKLALGRAVVRQELSDHRHLLGAVNGLVRPKEVVSPQSVRIEIAATLVAQRVASSPFTRL